MKRNRFLVTMIALVTASLAGVVGSGAEAFAMDDSSPEIVPVDAIIEGSTYGEWAAQWWQWAYSMPIDAHPLYDTADCSEGQSGQVWFLGGTFASEVQGGTVVGEATRHCSIPADKYIFVPILNVECSQAEGNGSTEDALRGCADFFMDHASGIHAKLDGKKVKDIDNFLVTSPLFEWGPLPENNVLQDIGFPDLGEGTTSIAVAKGYHLMIAPLSPGEHTLRFGGTFGFKKHADGSKFVFTVDITYNLTIVE